MKRSELVKVAEELTQVLGLEPKINLKAPVQSLKDKIIEAATLINPNEDEFSDETWTALQTIGALSTPQAAAVVDKSTSAPVEKPVVESKVKTEVKKEKPVPKKEKGDNVTVYGHRKDSIAGKLDVALTADSLSPEEVAKKVGCTVNRVRDHVRHLKNKKGIDISLQDGKYAIG